MQPDVIRLLAPVVLVAVVATAGLTGCSGSSDAADDASRAAGAGHFGQGGASLAGSGGPPSAGTGGPPSLSLGGNSSSSGSGGAVGSGASTACSAQTREGTRVPLDMYFLVDSSGSMGDDVDSGNKWDLVSRAMIDFLQDPRNAELGSGLGYFPDTVSTDCFTPSADCICVDFFGTCFSTSSGSCSAADYATPAVPLASSNNSDKVVRDLQARDVGGGTPTRPAVEGALQYLNDWASQHPERKPVLVLTTDGEPTDCDANTPRDVAAVAASALAGPHAIKTFVIGVGSFPESLDLVARAGGTDHAFLVDTNGDVATAFADALDEIRGAATSCDFSIPTVGDGGQKIDPQQVNVRYTPKQGGSPALVPQILQNDPTNCDAAGGWYYDHPTAPSLIRLCDSTCRAMDGGSIAIEFGCETIVQPPR